MKGESCQALLCEEQGNGRELQLFLERELEEHRAAWRMGWGWGSRANKRAESQGGEFQTQLWWECEHREHSESLGGQPSAP